MTYLVFNHDHNVLPPASDFIIPVQMYSLKGKNRSDLSFVGSPILKKMKRLTGRVSQQAMDFLSISLAVTAADTFVLRKDSADGWARDIRINLPLIEPTRWERVKTRLEEALHFLSGDIWRFTFTGGGLDAPEPYKNERGRKLIPLDGLDCVCLFSGGLDSTIGSIDLLSNGRAPLLVSHSYRGDKLKQNSIGKHLKGRFSSFSASAYPKISAVRRGKTDISMRTRSMSFLAFGVIGATAMQASNSSHPIELYMPENGFISLNVPLTPRRIGSLSTRTTHPFFIKLIQEIFTLTGISVTIMNPYQLDTKGEMCSNCQDRDLLLRLVSQTVSCSHWKRKNMQCGVCVPCLIRRAALLKSGINESISYVHDPMDVLDLRDIRDDLLAVSYAIASKDNRDITTWISENGVLPASQNGQFKALFSRGIEEISNYLKCEGIPWL